MSRHDEAVGLLAARRRTDAGQRPLSAAEVRTLRFIRHAPDLGYSVHPNGELVGLRQGRRRPSRQVKALAPAHRVELAQQAREILAMKATLEHRVRCCKGDDRPDCAILENLAEHGQEDVPAIARPRVRHGFAQR